MTRSIWMIFVVLFSTASISGHLLMLVLPQIPLAILIGACFLILLAAFDRWLWRLPILTTLRLISVPDLNGTWRGRISSSFQEHSQILTVDVQIEQRLFSTSILLNSTTATSKSIVAGCVTVNDAVTLAYIYHARPIAGFEHEISPHTGMCLLKMNSSEQLSGYYLYFDESSKDFVRGQLVLERGIYTILPGDELNT